MEQQDFDHRSHGDHYYSSEGLLVLLTIVFVTVVGSIWKSGSASGGGGQ